MRPDCAMFFSFQLRDETAVVGCPAIGAETQKRIRISGLQVPTFVQSKDDKVREHERRRSRFARYPPSQEREGMGHPARTGETQIPFGNDKTKSRITKTRKAVSGWW